MKFVDSSMMKLQLVLIGLGLALLAGCSGGGGGSAPPPATASSIGGTASAGAPIIGSVTIKDSSTPFQTKTVTIAADGKYTIDVSDLTAPYMMNANGTVGGTSYTLYSAATAADVNGNINVTPLTDLIIANVAGQIAGNYFTAGDFSTLTTVELNTQEAALRARLQPILTAVGLGASIDLLRTSFNTDHTGLDAALDVLRVDIVGGTATITNIISNQQITDDIASKVDAIVAIDATGVTTGITDFQAIVARFDAWSALFASSLPANNNATLLVLFDATFLFDGEDTAAFLSELTSDPTMVGVKFTNISLVPGSMLPLGSPTSATVNLSVIQGGGNPQNLTFALNKVGGVWKMAGNQQISHAMALSFTRLQDVNINNVPQTNYIDTGLTFEIGTPTAAGLASISASPPGGAGYYAIVTGTGLPAEGLLYVDPGTGNSMYAAFGIPSTYAGTSTPQMNSYGHNQYPLSDGTIATLSDNQIYMIAIWQDNATPNTFGDDGLPLATYTSNAGKRPYFKTDLAVASFATITAPTPTALTTFANAGGTTTVTWTLPTTTLGAKSNYLHYWRSGDTGFDSTESNLLSTATSGSVTMPAFASAGIGTTLVANGINLAITDSFSRELTTIYNGN